MMFGPGVFFGGWWMLLFWIVIITGVVLGIRAFTDQHRSHGEGGRQALDTLAQRYARGEISEQEFVRMREQLRR